MNSSPEESEPQNADVDSNESYDIQKVHAAIMREKGDPEDGKEPLSLWLVCFCGAVLFFGGVYLALYSGGFRWDVYSIYDGGLQQPGGGAAGGDAEKKELTLVEIGERVYRQNCVACHQGTGTGAAGQYPPLVGSEWVTGSEKRVAAILLHGIQGPIQVEGTTYNGVMPPWDKNLNDEKIAGVLSYIRQSWGNTASEITPAQVAVAREEYSARTTAWTEAELLAIPADATLPGGDAKDAAPAEGEKTPAPSGA